MCRRRLFKSNFYINYGGTKKAHGETVIVSPFVAGGGDETFELHSRNPWVITDNPSWLSVSSLSDKSGTYSITLTAGQNEEYVGRSGSFTAKTLDNRYIIIVSVSQEAHESSRYIEIVPRTASISSLGTASFTCILHNNGTTTDITEDPDCQWASNKTTAATVNKGVVTGCNNTKTAQTVTITATYQDLEPASATVTVGAGTQSWRNFRILVGGSESSAHQPINLTYANVETGVRVNTFIDEYCNEVKVQTWATTNSTTWSIADTSVSKIISGSTNSYVYSVYDDGTYYPTQRNTTLSASCMQMTSSGPVTFNDSLPINVAPRGLVEHVIVVTPETISMGAQDERQLQVMYYEVIDGVTAQTGTNITSTATYGGATTAITVTSGGKVQSNNTGVNPAHATITINYGDAPEVTVDVTAAEVQRQLSVGVLGKVSSNAGGTCISYTVSWTGLTVGSYIDMTAENASLAEYEIEVTAATGSVTFANSPLILQNEGDSRTILIIGEWRDNTAITGSDQWSQDGHYTPPVTEVHIYVDDTPDRYETSFDGESFGESYTLTWDPDVNPATFGYTIDPQTNAITSATIDYENSSFEVSGEANVTGNDKLGKVYITANTYSDVTRVVTFEFTLIQNSLIVTELNINGSTEKYLMLSGQMISFEVQDQNGNTLQSGLSPTNYYARLLGNGVTNDLAIWGYENGKAWIICKRNITVSKDYTVVFYTRESAGDVNVSCTIHCVPITLTATPNYFQQSGGTGTLSIKTYGNYYWVVRDNEEEVLDMRVTGTATGYGDTNGIAFAVYENMSEDEDSDYFYAVVNVVDEYGNSLTGRPVVWISQDEYTPTPPTPTSGTPWYIYSKTSDKTNPTVKIETGLEIRYDNQGDTEGGTNEFSPYAAVGGYPSAEANILIFGHTSAAGSASTRLLAETFDFNHIICRPEDVESRRVELLGTFGPAYPATDGFYNDIGPVELGRLTGNQSVTLYVDRIEMVTNERGKTLTASTFSPSVFTVTTANSMAEITSITFNQGAYLATLSCDTTTVRGESFSFHFNYGNGVTRVNIAWSGSGLEHIRCSSGLQTASTVDITNGSIIDVSNPGSLGAVHLSGTITGGNNKLLITAYDETPHHKELFYVDLIYENQN